MIPEEFVIQIGSLLDEDVYATYVVRSPAGEARSELKLPFSSKELDCWVANHGVPVNHPEPDTDEGSLRESITKLNPREMGNLLFEALFNGQVRQLYERSMGKTDQRLRIQLKLDPYDENLVRLARLPWELMREPSSPTPLCLRRSNSFVRYLNVPQPVGHPIRLPFRMLVILCNPKGLGTYDTQKTLDDIKQAWEGFDIQIDVPEKPTLIMLRRHLLQDPGYHIIHFTAHGGRHGDTWKLAFEDDSGGIDFVTGEKLATVLTGNHRPPYLVTLIACDGARSGSTTGFNPFNGVAHALVMSGVPAVIAMQFPISFKAAFTFAPIFYERLANRDSLDVAVNEARHAIYLENDRAVEWGTPVLFLRATESRLTQQSLAKGNDAPRKKQGGLFFGVSLFGYMAYEELRDRWGPESESNELEEHWPRDEDTDLAELEPPPDPHLGDSHRPEGATSEPIESTGTLVQDPPGIPGDITDEAIMGPISEGLAPVHPEGLEDTLSPESTQPPDDAIEPDTDGDDFDLL